MRDTAPKIEKLYHEMLMQRSGSDRMQMGAQMFETARQMALASMPPDLSEKEKRIRLFLRFYESDFGTERRDDIVRHLRALPCLLSVRSP